MFERLGVYTYRLRFLIVVAWVVLAVLSVRFAPSLASSGAADQASFLPAYASSVQAEDAIDRAFPGASSASSATLTFSREDGLTDADRAYVQDVAAWLASGEPPAELSAAVASVDSVTSRPELASMLRSDDGVLELLNVNLNIASAGDAAEVVVTQMRDHLAATAPAGLAAHVTGAAGITTDYLESIKKGTDSTTIVTIILVVVILLLIYRAPLAALVPLITIGAAFVVARGVLGVLAAAGWEVSSLLDTFIVVLVFGVGTDYAIFLISRYREEVGHEDWHLAVRDTVKRIGAVISASAATVIVGLAAMAFADFKMIQTTGPALGVAVFVTLIAGLTLSPALLSIFGHYLFWPLHMRTRPEGDETGFFARLATGVSHRPAIVTAVLVVLLAIPILYVPQTRTNFDTLAELPKTSDARIGYDIVAAHLGQGRITQSTALIAGGGSTDMLAPVSLARLRDTVLALGSTDGVDTVTSLVTPKGDGVVPDGFKPSVQLTTIADGFTSDGTSGAATDSSALLDTEVSDGLSSALDYVSALGAAYPDVAARSEYRATTQAIADAQEVVEKVRDQGVVSSQLRTLAAAMTSASSLAGGGSADSSLLADYLVELAGAYPEVKSLPAYADATSAAAIIAKEPTATAAVDASNALQSLATYFAAKPDATLFPQSLANTEEAKQAKREAQATFDALPVAFRTLGGVFAGRTDDIFVPVGLGGDQAADLQKAIDAFVSADRSATRFYVTTVDDPYSTAAFRTVRTVRDDLAKAAPAFGAGASAYLGGSTLQLADVQDVLQKDFLRVGIITVLGILLVLIVLLRALVAPLYLVGTVLLSYGSALGISAFLFQEILGHPGISFYLPLIVFVLLVALGADYNIFLMSRVREESEGRPIRDGIRIASGRTGAVITSAGLILAGTFGSMATAPLITLFQVGVAVAIGVLIDTFVVRSILVPAITMLVGERAWWPSGVKLTGGVVPVAVAEGGVLEAATEPGRRSPVKVAIALVLAALVPLTFAGLLVWSQVQGGSAPTPAAVVDLDEGTTVAMPDGTERTVDLGADLAAQLTAGTVTDAYTWTTTSAADAEAGLASGAYQAVLTIPAGFSRSIATIRSDTTGAQPQAEISLAVGAGSGADVGEVAREVRTAIAASAGRSATASYVEDVLVAVSSADAAMGTAATETRSIADSTSTIVDDASGIQAVSGQLVSGLDQLAEGTSTAAGESTKLVDGTQQLADGAAQVAEGATQVAAGVSDASTGAAQLASGADQLSSGLTKLASGTADLPAQAQQLATGASQLADGAAKAAAGAKELADGLAQLQGATAGLPGQAQQLADGAAKLADGAMKAAEGAKELADGLTTLRRGTSGMSAGAQQLAQGAASVASLATTVDGGATATAQGAAGLATQAGTYAQGVTQYTQSVSAISAMCATSGAAPMFCAQLAAVAGQGQAIADGAMGIATGTQGVADGTAQVAQGTAGLVQGTAGVATGTAQSAAQAPKLEQAIAASAGGAVALSDGVAALSVGAGQLSAGTAQLAAGMPTLTEAIASSATGAAQLSTGTAQVSEGAAQLSTGTTKLSDGMPTLADSVAQASTGASEVASGATQLATGLATLATGSDQVASGADATAEGATQLADGTSQAASGFSEMQSAVAQMADGARVIESQAGLLSQDGTVVADRATTVADGLVAAQRSSDAVPGDARTAVAERAADPIVVASSAPTGTGGTGAGIAPYIMALALWLGALVAFLVLPAGRRGRGRRWWAGPVASFAAAAALGIVGSVLMVAGLDLAVGIDVAQLPALVAVAALAAAAFTAIIQALVVAFGDRGWLVGLLLAGIQAAACASPVPFAALPAPLDAIHPFLPVTWAADAFRACIQGTTGDVLPAVVVLGGSLVVALLVTLAISFGSDRRSSTAPALA